MIEASILLLKLFYSQKRSQEANNILNSTKLQSVLADHIVILKKYQQNQLPNTDNLRQMQLFAEAHSIKGLCLESRKTHPINDARTSTSTLTASFTPQEEQEIIDSYEMSSLFAIEHSVNMHNLISSQVPATSIQASTSISNSASSANGFDAVNATLNSLNALNSNDDNLDLINPLYEVSLQKAPLLYIKKGYEI